MLCLTQFSIPDSILKITEMVKGILLIPKRFYMKMDSMGEHNLQLILIMEKQAWCSPIIFHQKRYTKY